MDDLISRRAVLETLDDMDNVLDEDRTIENYKELLKECYEVLPSVKPQEPCEDVISRKSLKHKLQENYDFFVNAYGGFSNLPQNDKSRVDEISNCIAMVVNEPPVNPQSKTGHWIATEDGFECSECGCISRSRADSCQYCNASMFESQEGANDNE